MQQYRSIDKNCNANCLLFCIFNKKFNAVKSDLRITRNSEWRDTCCYSCRNRITTYKSNHARSMINKNLFKYTLIQNRFWEFLQNFQPISISCVMRRPIKTTVGYKRILSFMHCSRYFIFFKSSLVISRSVSPSTSFLKIFH